ncbi:MAG TPA: tetratricopeptide repeat protein, partial [Terriglobia bacterium]|nr:tetratricopeptide repeat protein [Terriglobia bacterium]
MQVLAAPFALALALAQTVPLGAVKQLYDTGRWEEVVQLAPPGPDEPAEFDYYRGMALARLGRLSDARQALAQGRQKSPRDQRFPLELAGVAFKQNDFRGAKRELAAALRLDPRNRYALDFLATLYLLDGNLEAALKYWNRIGKPRIENVRIEPQPRVDPALLDHAFAFAPASVLRQGDLAVSQARVDALQIFPHSSFELTPRDDDSFDLTFRSTERDGWGGGNKGAGLVSLLGGLPYETVYPGVYNLGGGARNFDSLVRWDANKRRVWAAYSAPLGGDAKWRYRLHADARDENWDLTRTFYGAGPPLNNLKLERVEAGADLESVESGRWTWRTGLDLSRRSFDHSPTGGPPGLTGAAPFFSRGFALKYRAESRLRVLNAPERRFTLDATASAALGKILASASDPFAPLQAGLAGRWLPQSRGDDYETTFRLRGGMTLGQPPFDELFMLGMERDNDLWLRGHAGAENGRKGSAPLGRKYLLWTSDVDKTVYSGGFAKLK